MISKSPFSECPSGSAPFAPPNTSSARAPAVITQLALTFKREKKGDARLATLPEKRLEVVPPAAAVPFFGSVLIVAATVLRGIAYTNQRKNQPLERATPIQLRPLSCHLVADDKETNVQKRFQYVLRKSRRAGFRVKHKANPGKGIAKGQIMKFFVSALERSYKCIEKEVGHM
uniref:60S ribosomal protein L7a n=1 Tax=Steinernema glaseri TaxID=37863 RepID=A0A1I7XZH3_9BILA